MKVAIYSVSSLSYPSGYAKWIEQVASRLHDRNIEITIFTTNHGEKTDSSILKRLLCSGVKIVKLGNYERPFIVPTISSIMAIKRALSDFDILYFDNVFALNEIIVYLIKKAAHINVICGYHGTFPEIGNLTRRSYHRIINRRVARLFDAQHVLNIERETLLKSLGYKNVYKIPNGVDIKKFALGAKDDIFTVMFAGRMVFQKGIDILAKVIESLNICSNTENNLKFLVLGAGPLSHVVSKLQEKFDNIEYLGYASEEELVKSYEKYHVFFSPSRFEEFPLTALEAQAAGTPVIASDIPGLREAIINGTTGFLINTTSITQNKLAILRFREAWYNRPDEYWNYSSNARENAIRYDWNIIIRKLEDMFASVALR